MGWQQKWQVEASSKKDVETGSSLETSRRCRTGRGIGPVCSMSVDGGMSGLVKRRLRHKVKSKVMSCKEQRQ